MADIEINFRGNEFFSRRHIGPNQLETASMLKAIGFNNLDEFISAVVPEDILLKSKLSIGSEKKEQEALIELKRLASKNDSFNSYIGQGYYNTITPGVILRNVFENPGWYTSYTPYQSEISQGRLCLLYTSPSPRDS